MRTSRPRLRFAGRCVLFALPLAILGAWVEVGLRSVDNSYRAKRQQLETVESTLEVIVTGSSGAFDGVDPGSFGVPAYNLGNGSQTLHYDLQIVSRYLDRMPRLRLVVLALGYPALALELRNTREAWRQHFYSVFWNVPIEEPGAHLVTIQKYSYIALYTPMTSAKAAMTGFRMSPRGPFRDNGWNPPVASSATEHAEGLSSSWTRLRVEGHKDGMRPESQRRNTEAVRVVAERLRAKGAWLAVVWLPVSSEYTRWFGEEALASQRAAWEKLATLPNVRFFDYGSDPRFGPDDFANADHLGPEGARKFSEILTKETVRPILKLAGEPAISAARVRP